MSTIEKPPADVDIAKPKSEVAARSTWSPLKFSARQYGLIVAGLLILAGGVALLAASPPPLPANCVNKPSVCGYPDATNSGVPAGTALKTSGTINASTAGETISGVSITNGEIDVRANNVTIKDSKIVSGDGTLGANWAIYIAEGVTGTVIEDTTMEGNNCSNTGTLLAGVWNTSGDQLTMARDYGTCIDDILHGSGTITDSYSLDNGNIPEDHYEPVADDGGNGSLTAIHNTFLNDEEQTAAIFTQCTDGNVDSLTIENNLMSGGDYVVYGPTSDPCPNGGGKEIVTGNRFSNIYGANGGQYGLGVYFGNDLTWSNNYWDNDPTYTVDEGGNKITPVVLPTAPPSSGGTTTGGGGTTTGGGGTTTPPADTTPPTVSLTAPAGGTRVSGTATISAVAADNVGVTTVQFELDGQNLGAAVTTSPYQFSWNTIGVSNGTHTLTAIAKDAAGNTATATNVSVTINNTTVDTTPPSQPASLSATAITSAEIDLSWKASTDNIGVVSYKIYRNGPTTALATVSAPATSYKDKAVSANTAYTYTVVAADAAGNASPKSAAAAATTPKATDTTPPSVPTALTITATTASSVSLTWDASKDNSGGSGLAGYHVYRSSGASTTSTLVASPTGTSYTDINLASGTAYTYSVSAYDNAANGSKTSASVKATTKAATTPPPLTDTTAPSPPANLHTTATPTTSSIALAWGPSVDTVGGSGLAGYHLYRNGIEIATTTSTSYSDTKLSANTPYLYSIKAYDKAGNLSAVSSSGSVLVKTAVGKQGTPHKPAPKKHHHWWQFWNRN